MATITDFQCVAEGGQEVPCDAFGNSGILLSEVRKSNAGIYSRSSEGFKQEESSFVVVGVTFRVDYSGRCE